MESGIWQKIYNVCVQVHLLMNPYAVLHVSRDATEEEVKKAYQKELLKWHPDKCKSNESTTQFLKIQEAWSLIGNVEKKKQFDVNTVVAHAQAAEVVSLKEFTVCGDIYQHPCRCGGNYKVFACIVL